ncbi:MAG: hypothetical protein GSR85_08765 [Desulfurococcales archaeon]|nr:hypothetical protein [Desulfurococcales archaeon]
MARPEKVVKAKSWDELPDILEPGEYNVDGEKFVVYEPVEKEFMLMSIRGIKEMHKRYYG